MRSRGGWIALTALAGTGWLIHAQARASVAKQFVGAWRLVSTEQRLADGTTRPAPAFGPNGVGYLLYTESNRMCALLMDPTRPKWDDRQTAPPDTVLRSAYNGLAAYCGTYDVNIKEGYVVHHVELDKSPNAVGTDRKRFFTFSGNRLVLRPAPPLPAGVVDYSLTWERVEK